MEKVYKIWEIELQAVLEIHKIGHRKRILHSLIGQRLEPPNIEEINAGSSNDISTIVQKPEVKEKEKVTETKTQSNGKPVPATKPTTLSRHKKNRPAPQPPVKTSNLEIRAPSELLLAPTGLKAQWKHSASALVSGSIKYEVFVSLLKKFYVFLKLILQFFSSSVSRFYNNQRTTRDRIHSKINSETEAWRASSGHIYIHFIRKSITTTSSKL